MQNFITFNLERHWQSQDLDAELAADYFLNRIRDFQNQRYLAEKFTCFATIFWEQYYFHTKPFKEFIGNLIGILHRHEISLVLIVDTYHDDIGLDQLGVPVYYVDFFPWRCYQEIMIKNRCQISEEWTPQNKKFLFLTGKAHRVNRLRLLWKLHQQGLLDQCTWSLFVNDRVAEKSRGVLSELTDQEYQSFLQSHQSNPDRVTTEITADGDLHYNGIPYDADLFRNSLFRVVSETTFENQRPFVTEKTYITILNRCPFIIAGDVGILSTLEHQGFVGYREHLKLPRYDEITDSEQRLDAVVSNTQHWINFPLEIESIKEITQYNHSRFVKLAENTGSTLLMIQEKYQLSSDQFDNICPTDFFFHNW